MAAAKLSVDSLPVWASLNDIHIGDIRVGTLDGRGQGIIASTPLPAEDQQAEPPVLVRVPHEIILCESVIESYAKGDRRLKEILDAMGPQVSLVASNAEALSLTR
jgi:hypothetical protein